MTTPKRARGPGLVQAPQAQGAARVGRGRDGLAHAPWARVRRVQLIRREIRETLSPSALEVLFDHAELVVEGGEELGGRRAEDRRVFATVMITIDLARCAGQVCEPADEATARRVAELMEAEPRVHERLHALAARELARLGGAEPEAGPGGPESSSPAAPKAWAVTLETSLRVEGTVLLLDIDAMATFARARG